MKKMLVFLTIALVSVNGWAQIATNAYVHYDPSMASTVHMVTNSPPDTNTFHLADAIYVAQVDDLSSNGYHMIEADLAGHVEGAYPGHEFDTGVFGLDLGTAPFNGTIMDMLTPAQQDGLLDMIVNPNAALSIFFVVRLSESNWGNSGLNQTLIGNSPFPNTANTIGLFMRPSPNGAYLNLRLGGVGLSIDNMSLRLGERAVVALQYDDSTAYWRLEIAGSASSDAVREGIEFGIPQNVDLSSADDLSIGGSPQWANFYADVDVGEILMYDRFLNPTNGTEYAATVSALAAKWNTTVPAPPPEMNVTRDGNELTIAWSGPSTVERATDLVASNWTGYAPNGDESPVVIDLTTERSPAANYRLGTAPPPFSPAGPMIIQYDPSVASSIVIITNDPVVDPAYPTGAVYVAQIDDLTGNDLHAVESGPDANQVVWALAGYPSPFASGMPGVDCGQLALDRGTPFRMLTAGQSDFLLDFSGPAAGKGFSIFIVMKVEADPAGFPAYQSILSNGPFPNDGPYGVYRTSAGTIHHQLGGAEGVASGGTVPLGTECIIAVTYDDVTGTYSVENLNGGGAGTSSRGAGTKAATGHDYTSATVPLTLFSSPIWVNFYCDATYGEVRVYDEYYDPAGATYGAIMSELESKWLLAAQ